MLKSRFWKVDFFVRKPYLQALADCSFEVSSNILFAAGDSKRMLKACTQTIVSLVGEDVPISNEVEAHLLGLKDINSPIQAKTIIKTIECTKPLL